MFDTPILFLIFNRPDNTLEVFNKIRQIKPKFLFVAADGHRKDKLNEDLLCLETRNIIKNIDWDCDLKTLYRDENVGCGRAITEAITWFFENVEMGIILEDDCLPLNSFFSFCEDLLVRYRYNDRIMQISGCNFTLGLKSINESYYFSRIPITWGWATWKRAWNKMNYEMRGFFEKRDELHPASNMWKSHWDSMVKNDNEIDTWDFQWYYSIYENNGIVIHPKYNLILNIGFNAKNATHTFKKPWWYIHLVSKDIYKLKHPTEIKINEKMDNQFELIYTNKKPSVLQRMILKSRLLYKI